MSITCKIFALEENQYICILTICIPIEIVINAMKNLITSQERIHFALECHLLVVTWWKA